MVSGFLVLVLELLNLLPTLGSCQFFCYVLVCVVIPGSLSKLHSFASFAPQIYQNQAVFPCPLSKRLLMVSLRYKRRGLSDGMFGYQKKMEVLSADSLSCSSTPRRVVLFSVE